MAAIRRADVHVLGVPLDLGWRPARRGHGPLGHPHRRPGRTPHGARAAWSSKRATSRRPSQRLRPSRTATRSTSAISRASASCSTTRSSRAHADGALPLVLGGDHSLAAGSVGASADFAATHGRDIGLIWVDAHGDMNTPSTTTSGNVHGMPLAALLGPEPAELAAHRHARPEGARGADRPHRRPQSRRPRKGSASAIPGVHLFTMKDIDRHGIASVMERALAIAGSGTFGIHVSFDLDVCDPSIAPGVGTPVKGGLDYREAHMVMEMVADSGRLIALDLVEINPILDTQNQTAILGAELISSAMGMRII